jgi:hypothetical protein
MMLMMFCSEIEAVEVERSAKERKRSGLQRLEREKENLTRLNIQGSS